MSQAQHKSLGPNGRPGWCPSRPPRRARPTLEPLEERALLHSADWLTYAHDPQHTGLAAVAAQPLAMISWQTPVDLAPDSPSHYGSPLVTVANTVIVPVHTGMSEGLDTFAVEARSGADGTFLWSLPTDYRLPPHHWIPSYSPTLTANRLYYPGAAGSVLFRDDPDAPSGTTGRIAFYGSYDPALANRVMIHTPITADAAGNIYFGFVVTAEVPNLERGMARISASGVGTWVSAASLVGVAGSQMLMNSAPALANDGGTLYEPIRKRGQTPSSAMKNWGKRPIRGGLTPFPDRLYVAVDGSPGYLVALDSSTLAYRNKVALHDPRSASQSARLSNDSTSSPTVGPDGDVYFGVQDERSLGWLLHFSADLSQSRIPGGFGWDSTAAIVPRDLVPSYTGTSAYLVFSKYNNYQETGGDGVNQIAVLDPSAAELDTRGRGVMVMQEVLTIAGVTPDPVLPAVREWCLNAAAVDPFTKSVMANSADGALYRWDLKTNTLSESIQLTGGASEAYTPTVIGVDGSVYAINDHTLFAVHAWKIDPRFFGPIHSMPVPLAEPVAASPCTPDLPPRSQTPVWERRFAKLLFREQAASRNRSFQQVRSQTGVWERDERDEKVLGSPTVIEAQVSSLIGRQIPAQL